jgi:hypothetical protein
VRLFETHDLFVDCYGDGNGAVASTGPSSE